MSLGQIVTVALLVARAAAECSLSQVQNQFSSAGIREGCSKNLTYVSNIDYRRIQGAWYIQFLSSDGSELGCEGCWTVYFTEQYSGSFVLVFCCQRDNQPYCNAALGGGTVSDRCGDGQFLYQFQGVAAPSYIVDADPDSFFISHVCVKLPSGETKQATFVLSRTPTVCKCTFQPFIFEILRKNGIDPGPLVAVEHGKHCKYTFGCQSCGCGGASY